MSDELQNFDPTEEGGGRHCHVCGVKQEPWRYSDYCQACIWDGLADLDPDRPRSTKELAHERVVGDLERMIELAIRPPDEAA